MIAGIKTFTDNDDAPAVLFKLIIHIIRKILN